MRRMTGVVLWEVVTADGAASRTIIMRVGGRCESPSEQESAMSIRAALSDHAVT
jgi:hypothetical protein